ncbi:uncharacterized protein LOC120015110 [Tripterygium wilfordii]|uniref:uncharacterized protein LOC120015110 n=1 Tax=Tripterygium wilfordii TaxID=458696 RepID=UPI0018F82E19|nr:uncharacterized protein LOC120015110 [Tripterygium wilfordii]
MVNRLAISFTSAELASHGFTLSQAPILILSSNCRRHRRRWQQGRLRRLLKNAEEEAVEIVKEGFEAAEKGLETAEKGVKSVERGVEAAEKEVEEAVSFPALAQAGVVVGAEVVGVLAGTSVVNGILETSQET